MGEPSDATVRTFRGIAADCHKLGCYRHRWHPLGCGRNSRFGLCRAAGEAGPCGIAGLKVPGDLLGALFGGFKTTTSGPSNLRKTRVNIG